MTQPTATYHHGNLKQALLDEAIAEIRANGVENLSLRALARGVGVSQTAPYRHFTDKDALLAELATQAFNDLAAAARAELQPQRNALENVIAAGIAYVRFGINHPEKYRLMFGTSIAQRDSYPELTTAGNGAFELLSALIAQGQQAGIFVAGNAELMANACWSSLHGFVLLSIDGLFARRELPASPEEMLQYQVEFTLRGIKI